MRDIIHEERNGEELVSVKSGGAATGIYFSCSGLDIYRMVAGSSAAITTKSVSILDRVVTRNSCNIVAGQLCLY